MSSTTNSTLSLSPPPAAKRRRLKSSVIFPVADAIGNGHVGLRPESQSVVVCQV